MKSHVFWFSSIMFVLLCIEACSPLDFVNETPDYPSEELAIATKGSSESDIFYYYFGEKIFLQEREDMLFLKFVDIESRELFLKETLNGISLLKVYNPNGELQFESPDSSDILILESGAGAITDDYLAELSNREDVVLASRLLEYQGRFMARSSVFAVKLKSTSDLGVLKGLAAQYNCEIWRYEWTGENVYYLNIPKHSEWDAINLSNLFFETGMFEFSSPDFFVQAELCSADAYYTDQWGLKNTGQYNNTSGKDIDVEAAWTITEGSSDITVAVIDQGVELTHPDLAANMVSGYDATTNTSPAGGPVLDGDNHGTAVAGIIGAIKDNGIGITGVAPGCKIMPIRVSLNSSILFGFNYTQAANAFDWARTHGADVINCSWSGIAPNSTLTTAISNALTLGRNGKGCVVVFSSGNGDSTIPYPASLGGVLTVGAISYDGKRKTPSSPDGEYWWGSNYGTAVDLVAPGVQVATTDRSGSVGYNPPVFGAFYTTDYGNQAYTQHFNGTSSAAPHVAGVAALILSAYPDLKQYEVRRVLLRSCTYLIGHSYYNDNDYPSFPRSDEVGYGLVNAYGAFQQVTLLQQEKLLDATPGIDFTITNNSSYEVDEIYLEVTAKVGGVPMTLLSDEYGAVSSGKYIGYPVYRGITFTATPGTPITDISVELYARTIDCPGNVRLGVEIDNLIPTYYSTFVFGWGNTYYTTLANTTVPGGSRRRLYINILDPM